TVGAWQDAVESVARHAGEPLDAHTPEEVAERAAAVAPTGAGAEVRDRVLRLGALAETALYAPDTPDFRLTPPDADAASAEADRIRRLLGRPSRRRRPVAPSQPVPSPPPAAVPQPVTAQTDGATVMPAVPESGSTIVVTEKQ